MAVRSKVAWFLELAPKQLLFGNSLEHDLEIRKNIQVEQVTCKLEKHYYLTMGMAMMKTITRINYNYEQGHVINITGNTTGVATNDTQQGQMSNNTTNDTQQMMYDEQHMMNSEQQMVNGIV
ncbi:hypothetical protein BYT27DRAFT_7206870 [Phlegmacium glaucopus]|nr:hypothetical protein BYT27DRAFT_7206870 [Phlegmacium glaucopus]